MNEKWSRWSKGGPSKTVFLGPPLPLFIGFDEGGPDGPDEIHFHLENQKDRRKKIYRRE